MKWYKIIFTHEQMANHQGQKLSDEFNEIYLEEEMPDDMALFYSKRKEEDCIYYFSPAAVKYSLILLSYFSGSKCDPPKFEDVNLVHGTRDAKKRLLSSTD